MRLWKKDWHYLHAAFHKDENRLYGRRKMCDQTKCRIYLCALLLRMTDAPKDSYLFV